MWPFDTLRKASVALAASDDRLTRIEQVQEKTTSDVRRLKLEWEDVYDRLERIVGRINARARTEARQEATAPAADHEPTDDEINQAIRDGTYPVVTKGARR